MTEMKLAGRGRSLREGPALVAAGFGLFALMIMARRLAEFVHPSVWDEDGPRNIQDYVAHGLHALVEPVNGYLILAPKLISLIALKLSFVHYAAIANVLATAFDAFALICVWKAPTYLRWPFLCALAVALVPSDPEVFVLPLYAFWFAGIILVLAALWRREADSTAAAAVRCGLVLLGGLSSPLIMPLSLVFAGRALIWRGKEIGPAILAVACAAVQLITLRTSGQMDKIQPLSQIISPAALNSILNNYVGGFFRAPFIQIPVVLVALGLAVVLVRNWRRIDLAVTCLFGLYLMGLALSFARAPPAITSPYGDGPRYFFYPFVFLSWFLLNLAAVSERIGRTILVALLALTASASLMRYQRNSDPLYWNRTVLECSRSGAAQYAVPVHSDGVAWKAWNMTLRPEDCRRLRRESLWDGRRPLGDSAP